MTIFTETQLKEKIYEDKPDYYVIGLEWFNKDEEWYEQRPMRYYCFDSAADALNVAHAIVKSKSVYEYYKKPSNVFLYGATKKNGFSSDIPAFAWWIDIHPIDE